MTPARRPVVIIGLGNPMRQDDGVGPATISMLRAEDLGPDVELAETDGESTRVLDLWNGRRAAIVIDAVVAGAEPGTLHDLEARELDSVSGPKGSTSSHHAGLAEALELGRALGRLPETLRVMGIEPATVGFGEGLSPSVANALPELLARIRQAATLLSNPADHSSTVTP